MVFHTRKEGIRLQAQYREYARGLLASSVKTEPCLVRPDFQTLRPRKALGMFENRAEISMGKPFRWINASRSTLCFFIKMFTILFAPDFKYNLPMLSIDVIFMGRKRVFVIEIIDPVKRQDATLLKHYATMRTLKPPPEVLREKPVERWYKDVLADFSIHAVTDRSQDSLLFDTYTRYLQAYLCMAAEALPCGEQERKTIKDRMEWYVTSLINQGGPAVDVLGMLLGREKMVEYARTVMFGFDR